MKYDLIETGKRIAAIRKQNGLTQLQFAEMLYITKSHLARIENGRRGASVELMVDIACLFNLSLDYLILGKEKCDSAEIKAAIRNAIDVFGSIESKL